MKVFEMTELLLTHNPTEVSIFDLNAGDRIWDGDPDEMPQEHLNADVDSWEAFIVDGEVLIEFNIIA